MIYLMNSAVMPAGRYGRYTYRPATLDDLRTVVQGEFKSAIGYPQNAELIARWTGVTVPVRRDEVEFYPGDRALVMRLKSRVSDPATKGCPVSDDPGDWEFAWVEFQGSADEMTQREKILTSLGWAAYAAALHKLEEAREEFNNASRPGYLARKASVVRTAEVVLADAGKRYPGAALYARAVEYAHSPDALRSGAGVAAVSAIEAGADPASVISKMEKAWHASAREAGRAFLSRNKNKKEEKKK